MFGYIEYALSLCSFFPDIGMMQHVNRKYEHAISVNGGTKGRQGFNIHTETK